MPREEGRQGLKLQLFGGFRLSDRKGRPIQLPTRKAEALLAVLALAGGGPQRRERLTGLLWGDRGEKQARHSLNQTIFTLRKAVEAAAPALVATEGETVALAPDAIAVDALRFERLAAAPENLEEAVALYQGDLLAGIGLREPAFEEWLTIERARFAELALATAKRLLERQRAARDNDGAVQTALRVLALDPLQEEVHRLLMELYAGSGRHGAAIKQYESCRAVLQRELGVAPQAETENLLRRIKTERARQRTPALAPAAAADEVAAVAPAEPAPPEPQPERKRLTILYAELDPESGGDPEAELERLDGALEAAGEEIRRHDGLVIGRQGPTLTALFGAPFAHEDHAVRACFAALAARKAVAQTAEGRIRITAGLHSGEVIFRSFGSGATRRHEAIGPAVALAIRIAQALPRGSIGMSAETQRQAEGFVETEPLRPIEDAEEGGRIAVRRLTRRLPLLRPWQARAARGLTAFVGRETQMGLLTQALERTAGGRGELVSIVGAPGVGKSRLVHEFARHSRLRDWQLLEAGASALERTAAYGAISQMLRSWFQVQEREPAAAIAARVRERILGLDEALAPALPALFSLLDLPIAEREWNELTPAQRRQRTHSCLKAVLSRLSRERPVLMILEDLHWIDEETQSVLDTLVEGLGAMRLLLLVTHRPEYRHDWAGRSSFSAIRLDPLAPDSALQLLQALLGEDAGLDTLRRILVDWTEGTPLYLEETVRHLVEIGALAGTRGDYRLVSPIESIDIPTSIHSVLAARIDRLPANAKRLLQAAAVIGAELPAALLKPLSELADGDYEEALAALQSSEFLFETRQLPDLEYGFKHALTHDVAYNSLLRERRRALHVRLVEIIEHYYAERLEEQSERLAHHAAAGGLTEKAVDYAYRAAAKAIRRSAHGQAILHLRNGLALLDALPNSSARNRTELEFQKAMGIAMMQARGWGAQEVSDAYLRARELCEEIGDTQELFTVLRGQGQFHMIRGELKTARALGDRCVALSAELRDPGVRLETHHLFWTNSFFMGDFSGAAHHADEGIRLYEEDTHHPLTHIYSGHDPGVCCRAFSGLILWQQGQVALAGERCTGSLALAEKLSHPLSLALAHWALSYLHMFREEPQEAARWAELEISVCREYLLPLLYSIGLFQLAWAEAQDGMTAAGLARMEEAVGQIRATGSEMGLPYFVALLGHSHARFGNLPQGMHYIDEAIASSERAGAYFGYSEMLRLKGEILLAENRRNREQAEASFLAAVDWARRQGAQLLELKAANCLARLWLDRRDDEKARALIAPLLDRLPNDEVVRDIAEARALLVT